MHGMHLLDYRSIKALTALRDTVFLLSAKNLRGGGAPTPYTGEG